MAKQHPVELKVSKKRDIALLEYIAKHLNQGAGGQRAARTRRKKSAKK